MRSAGTGRQQPWHQQPCRGRGSWARNAPASGNWGQAWLPGSRPPSRPSGQDWGRLVQGRADVCSGAGEKGHRAEGGTKVAIRPPPLEPSRGHTPGSLEAPCSRSQIWTSSGWPALVPPPLSTIPGPHPKPLPRGPNPTPFLLFLPPSTAQRAEHMGNRGHSVRGCPACLLEELLGFQFGAHPAGMCDLVPASPFLFSVVPFLVNPKKRCKRELLITDAQVQGVGLPHTEHVPLRGKWERTGPIMVMVVVRSASGKLLQARPALDGACPRGQRTSAGRSEGRRRAVHPRRTRHPCQGSAGRLTLRG